MFRDSVNVLEVSSILDNFIYDSIWIYPEFMFVVADWKRQACVAFYISSPMISRDENLHEWGTKMMESMFGKNI